MSLLYKTWNFCIIMCCFPFTLWATIEVRSKHMTTHDGIANNSIRCIFQDSKGFIWLGTLNGLSRYDGNNFFNFRPDPNNLSLADQRIRHIDEDKNGFLWINFITELYSCYDLQHGRFVDYTGCGEYTQHYGHKLQASNGDTWLWHKSNGCRRVKWKDGHFTSFTFKKEKGNLPTNHVTYVYEDKQERIWIGTNKGVVLVEDNEQTRLVIDMPNAYKAYAFEEQVFFISSKGVISQVKKGSTSAQEVGRIPLEEHPKVCDIMPLQDNWYIFTSKGGYKFNF